MQTLNSGLPSNVVDVNFVGTLICRLAILGGLDLKRGLDEKKILKSANPDQLVVEGISFTFTHIYRACLTTKDVNIYNYDKLASRITLCPSVLHELMENTTGLTVPEGFTYPYVQTSLQESAATLGARLFAAAGHPPLTGLNDRVITEMTVNIFAVSMLPGMIEAVTNALKLYTETHDD